MVLSNSRHRIPHWGQTPLLLDRYLVVLSSSRPRGHWLVAPLTTQDCLGSGDHVVFDWSRGGDIACDGCNGRYRCSKGGAV